MSLELHGVSVHFGGVAALAGVSFAVEPGRVTSLIGPNGAGKTTAFNVITGFQRPTTGEVRWEGRRIHGLRPCRVAERGIVRTFQKTSVFPALSVIDNVMTALHLTGRVGVGAALLARGRVEREERTQSKAALAILDSVGLSMRRDERAGALSYGDQRRVEIAIALAARPKLLLLDEPASGMTPAEKDEVAALIGRVRAAGTDVFLVEHDMRLVMGISDRVLVLNHGQLIADGPPAAVRRDPAVIRAYLGSSGVSATDLEAGAPC